MTKKGTTKKEVKYQGQYAIVMSHMDKDIHRVIKRLAKEEKRTVGNQAEIMLRKYIDHFKLWVNE